MLKTRVIPILLLKDGLLNKPVQFKRPRTVADPIAIARVFEERQVDELILLDVGSSIYNEAVNEDIVSDIADELSLPFTVGGGIRTVEGGSCPDHGAPLACVEAWCLPHAMDDWPLR